MTTLFCSPSSSLPSPQRQRVVKTPPTRNDTPKARSTRADGADPSPSPANDVTITVAGAVSGQLAPSTEAAPPPAVVHVHRHNGRNARFAGALGWGCPASSDECCGYHREKHHTGAASPLNLYAFTSNCKRRGEEATEAGVQGSSNNPITRVSTALDPVVSHV
jgi:hypothetical protein